MLELPNVTLLCADTANHALALRALERSAERVRFARIALLTDRLPAGVTAPAGIEVVAIPILRSRDDYSQLMIKGLREHVATSHVLVVQWDGYVLNPDAWDPAFLATDFIGAKWFWHRDGHTVGNGGFSMRSRRLLDALQDPRIHVVEAEDITIGRAFRTLLERDYDIRFASEAQADRFAFEAAYPIGMPFGFHGLFNFVRVVAPHELASLAAQFSDAIASSPQLAQLLRNCMALGHWTAAIALATRRLAAQPHDAEAQALLARARESAARGPSVGRNDPCPCGSGKRYKLCHGALGASTPLAADPGTRPARDPAAPLRDPAAAPSVRDLAAALPARDAARIVADGMAAHRRGDRDEAQRAYESALQLDPDNWVATHYLGVLAYQRGNLDVALPLLERSARAAPHEPEFQNNVGLALAAVDRLDEAVAAYQRAVSQRSHHAGAWSNLGLAYTAQNALGPAEDAFRRAIAVQPDFAAAHWNLALVLLAQRRYEEGWREYEWRLRAPEFAFDAALTSAPRWDGESLEGRRLLLVAEQGLGDALQFIRYAEALAKRGAHVVARMPQAIAHLAARVPGVAEVNVRETSPPATCDFHLPLLSVPGALDIRSETEHAPRFPYLRADPERRERVVREVRARAGARRAAGLAWAGARANTNDRRRSMPLAALSPLLERDDIAWFSLQHEDSSDVAGVAAAARLQRLDDRIGFEGLAALVDVLDLVVTVDTSVAHVAGALARPVWMMVPFAADWRWGVEGDTTGWYPTMRLVRQRRPGDWSGVVQRIARALSNGTNP